MRFYLFFLVLFTSCTGTKHVFYADEASHLVVVEEHQNELNEQFLDPERSPLKEEAREYFDHLDFFPVDIKYQVEASFVRTPDEKPFQMPTTTDRLPVYMKYGEAHFSLDGKDHVLNLYQNQAFLKTEYGTYLFIPFRDETSGVESYGGGRYIDIKIPRGKTVVIDFNQSYNPYCAYNDKYSCPIPPVENTLEILINAGIKTYEKQ